MNIKISVIIPTKNRIEDIKNCIESISAQTRLPDELVVVDSSDTEELKSWLDSFFRSRFSVPFNFDFKSLTPHHLGDMSHQIPHNILSFADQTLNRTDTFVFSYSPYQE